jgi:hypothetical protein
MKLRAFLACTVAGALVAAGACGQTDQRVDTAKSVVAHSVDTGASPSARVEREAPLGGPIIVVDSNAREARIETRGGTEYVLYLPPEMARALYDSLPGFTPLQQSNYPADLASKHTSPLRSLSVTSTVTRSAMWQ